MIYPEENGREDEVRNAQEESQHLVDGSRARQSEGFGTSSGVVGVGVDRDISKGGEILTIGSISGGILARLRASEQRRLAEADECLEWYERQRTDALKELAEIEALERLERQSRESRNGH